MAQLNSAVQEPRLRSSVLWCFYWENSSNWVDNVAKRTLKRKDHFSLRKTKISTRTPWKEMPWPPANAAPVPLLSKREARLGLKLLPWQHPREHVFYGKFSGGS